MKKRDWIFDGSNIGRVKNGPYPAPVGKGMMIDVTIYNLEGTRVGRVSPAMGGPRHFEPCCDVEVWEVIEPPRFPLSKWNYLEHQIKRVDASATADVAEHE